VPAGCIIVVSVLGNCSVITLHNYNYIFVVVVVIVVVVIVVLYSKTNILLKNKYFAYWQAVIYLCDACSGAVAQDGRVEPGDMILEVNGISFENMSNDDAVKTLREAVQKPG
jgi:hypothetical protein